MRKLILLFIFLLPTMAFGSKSKIEKDQLWLGEGTFQDYEFFFDVGSGSGNNPYIRYDSSEDLLAVPAIRAESTTVPSRPASVMTQGARDLTTPGQGDQVFNSTTSKLNVYDGTEWTEVGVGGAGEINNLLTDPGFESGVDEWTSTVGTISQDDVVFKNGENSLKVTSGSTIDIKACKTNTQWETRQYEVGCYVKSTLEDIQVCNGNGTVSDECNSTYDGSGVFKYISKRRTLKSGEDMCLHVKSASAGTINLENCLIGEPEFSTAEIDNDVDMQPCTVTGSWTSGATYNCLEGRDGQWAIYDIRVDITGAVSPVGVNLTVNLPSGRVIDTSAMTATPVVGDTELRDSSILLYDDSANLKYYGNVTYNSTTSVQPRVYSDNGSQETNAPFHNTDIFTKAINDYVDVRFRVPIVGWTAKNTNTLAQVQDDRPARVSDGTTQSIADSTVVKVQFTSDFDIDSNWDAVNDEWVSPRSGVISAKCQVRFEFNAAGRREVRFYKNGNLQKLQSMDAPAANQPHVALSTLIEVDKGDTIDCRVLQNSGGPLNVAVSSDSTFASFHYVDSKALLSGLEDINTKPSRAKNNDSTNGISSSTLAFIGFALDYDQDSLFSNIGSANNSVHTSTTYWTAPKSGKYDVDIQVYTTDIDLDAEEQFRLGICVNGAEVSRKITQPNATATGVRYSVSITDTLILAEGDKVSACVFHEAIGTISLNSTTDASHFVVKQNGASLSSGANFVEKFQTKSLSADITASGTLTDLTFSNLEVGKCYEAIVHAYFSKTIDTNTSVTMVHNGNTLGRVNHNSSSATSGNGIAASHITKFIATATTLTFSCGGCAGSATLLGDGTQNETHAQLTEKVNGCIETNQW